jgi:DNA-binding response OmpR family regulator
MVYNLPMKILIIEDDSDIASFIKKGFEAEGMVAEIAPDGPSGSYKARVNTYDIIILDYSLPLKDGITVCKEIRANGSTIPILFLSVVDSTQQKIDALEKGADDYITKPFSFDELKARVKALLRRPKRMADPIVKLDNLILNLDKKMATRGKTPLALTKKEYNLLEYMMLNPGKVISRSMILEHVWNAESDPFSNTVEVHMRNLRKKINIEKNKDLIRNLPGRGYVME